MTTMTKMRRPDLIFEDALNAFLATEGSSLLSDGSERNTCGRIAIHLERQIHTDGLSGYYADPEYDRKQHGQVKTIIDKHLKVVQITPDLIVHTRGQQPPPRDNLIAVEVKKASRPQHVKDDDRIRVQAMTKPIGRCLAFGRQPSRTCVWLRCRNIRRNRRRTATASIRVLQEGIAYQAENKSLLLDLG